MIKDRPEGFYSTPSFYFTRIQRLNGVFFIDCRTVFRWLVCHGVPVRAPPDTPHEFRGKPLKTPKKPPAYATRALTAGCSFCPYGGRNAVRQQGKRTGRSYWLVRY